MIGLEYIILALIFLVVSGVTYGFTYYHQGRRRIKERFKKPAATTSIILRKEMEVETWKSKFLKLSQTVGKWAMKESENVSELRIKLIQAGYPKPYAPTVFFALRTISAFSLPIPFMITTLLRGQIGSAIFLIAFLVAAVGYYLPNYILTVMVRQRQDRIDRALPDVLDLMIVSLEAGLALPAALNRVGEEIRPVSKDLALELQITNAELRTGIHREVALKNIGERTGVQSVKSLVALMVQSERMGATISAALRTHAEYVRVQRAQKAEELAAKLPVKILFPMMFCILPSLFIVVIGPAAIQISKTLFK